MVRQTRGHKAYQLQPIYIRVRPHKFVAPFTIQSDITAKRVPDVVTGPIRDGKRENAHRNQKMKRGRGRKQDKLCAGITAVRR